MEVAVAAESFAQPTQPFTDGFGERRAVIDARGEHLEILRLSLDLSATPSFESALRERANRIAGFRHESFSHIRSIEVERPSGALLVVSDHVRGARLSTLLAAAEKRSVPIDMAAATCMIRQLVHAVSAWREQMPDVVHGAIGSDRLVITPDGRLVVVDHVLGSALEQLRYSRQQYWEELGVPLPVTFKFAINARADVLQVGAVAFALLLGRRLTAADRIDEMQQTLAERVMPPLRTWLLRALQLEPVGSYTSVLDARAALDTALGEANPAAEQDGLLLFMARCLAFDVASAPAASPAQTGSSNATVPESDDLPDVDLGIRIEALRAFLARRSPRNAADSVEAPAPLSSETATSQTEDVPSPSTGTAQSPTDDTPLHHPRATSHPDMDDRRRVSASALPVDWTRRLWIAAAAMLVIGAVVLAFVMGAVPWSGGPSTGALSITTRPAGIPVTIDGTPRGVTPLAIDLPPGSHLVELVTDTEQRKIPVTIRAGSESSQFLEMGGAVAATATELRVRTEPLGASVTIDGRYVGRSPVSVADLAPGSHTVVLKHETGSATEQVLIEPGKTASLFVPLVAPPSTTAAGWISVAAAPVDVQIFENGRFLGSSRIDRIMLPAGRHDLDIINEALGYQERRTVRVDAGQTAVVSLKWPTGSLSLNAVPWAQVFIDGTSVGETPIANMQVPIGPHEILFRHPQLGERRAAVTVTARETARVGVDLRK